MGKGVANKEPIDMVGGRWAFREDASVSVRVLCVDRPGPWSVVSMDEEGTLRFHGPCGQLATRNGGMRQLKSKDLVPCSSFVQV